MNNLVPFFPKPLEFSADALANINALVPKGRTREEFDRFISICKFRGLDPRAGHIMMAIYNEDKPDKRQVVTIITEQGYLAAANRCRDERGALIYKPDDKTPRFTYSEALKGANNPLGIESCTVSCYKFLQGEWHESPAEVFWDERVPTVEEWTWNPELGKRAPTGRTIINPKKNGWVKQPRTMLAKCARVAAVRYAFPDQFGGLYAPEEADAIEAGRIIDISATSVIEETRHAERMKAIGATESVLLSFDPERIEPVPLGQIHDRIEAHFKQHPDAAEIRAFVKRNRAGIRQFNGMRSGDWVDLKKRYVDGAAEEMKQRELSEKARTDGNGEPGSNQA